jgi:peptidoglycan/xylan/chitin deacetylase (PgdA/CDA1 family)
VNKTDYRNQLSGVAGLFSIQFLRKLSGQFLIHPFYHAVSDNPPAHLKHLYPIKSIKKFKDDLDFYLKYFAPLSPELLINNEWLNSKEPYFLLSFDDGLREVKDFIIPILMEKGIKAIFFINNSFIDNKDIFFRYKASLLVEQLHKTSPKISVLKEISRKLEIAVNGKNEIIQSILAIRFHNRILLDYLAPLMDVDFSDYLKKQKPYLMSHEITDIKNKGFFIGSHSFDHPDFACLNEDDQLKEISRSANDITSRFGLNYKYFAFPFTDHDISNKVLKRMHDKDNSMVNLSFGTAGLKNAEQFLHFQRIGVEKTVHAASVYLKSEYFYYLLKGIIGKNKLRRR